MAVLFDSFSYRIKKSNLVYVMIDGILENIQNLLCLNIYII